MLAIIQNTVLAWKLAGAQLDLFLILTVFVAFSADPYESTLAGWSVGLFKDLFSIDKIGIYAFLFALVALATTVIRKSLYRAHPATVALVVLVASLACNSILAVRAHFLQPDAALSLLALRVLVGSALTALAAPLVFPLLTRLSFGRGFAAANVQ